MSHPDQHTPADHRSSTDQDAPLPNASQDLTDDLQDEALEDAADTGATVRTPEPVEKRQGEAGNTYSGRQMSDTMKDNPRVDDAERVRKDAER